MSTSTSPSRSTTIEAPSSSPEARFCSSADRTPAKRSSHVPCTSVMCPPGRVTRAAEWPWSHPIEAVRSGDNGEVDPSRTALLVGDVQQGYLDQIEDPVAFLAQV